jgi:hypothetical protein
MADITVTILKLPPHRHACEHANTARGAGCAIVFAEEQAFLVQDRNQNSQQA